MIKGKLHLSRVGIKITQIEKSVKGKKKKKKKHTSERDLVLGPVTAEVVDPPAGNARLKAKQLLPRADFALLDPLYTDWFKSCCCRVEDRISIYKQLMSNWYNEGVN
jgi:hypothetical protein